MDIKKLRGITQTEIDALLHRAKIKTVTDLWERAGKDPDTGIDQLSKDTGIDRSRLVELLVSQAYAEAEEASGSWLERHWLEVMLAFVVLLIIGLGIRDLGAKSLDELAQRLGWGPQLSEQVVITLPAGAPAFHTLQSSDLNVDLRPVQVGSFRTVEDVVGRITLQALPAGTVVQADQVGAGQDGADFNQIMNLEIASPALDSSAVGQKVRLILSPRAEVDSSNKAVSSSGKLIDAILLAIHSEASPPWVTVAVRQTDVQELADALAQSEVFVVIGRK